MISTGMKGLDEILTGLRAGDNVVWQIDDIEVYADLVEPFVEQALKDKKKVIYMRFASHQELLKSSDLIKRYELNANIGFEAFTTKINSIIDQEGEGAYYVFDCLSELISAWASDLMISNFFMVTCPFLYELRTITYFSILRNNHSFKSIAQIRETTQLLIDVYRCEGNLYIHPLKVWNRYTPTMFLPHQKENQRFIPVADSVNAATLLSYIHEKGAEGAKRNLDYWDRLFLEAQELKEEKAAKSTLASMVKKLSSLMITKNKKMLELVIRHFTLEELIDIKSRLIGTGFVGGKTVGMLLARKILSADKDFKAEKLLEGHDSFYVGSDIFYSYIVQNRLWKLRMQQRTSDGYFKIAKILKEKMLYGTFSDEIKEQFQQIIEYFGVSPIIIRSSSLLEDSFGNAFAGKYESIFLANQGTPEERYIKFAEAVKRIYSSTMSEDALAYRKQRGLDELDEQMALLIQRVSGSYHQHYFFPDLAGVGVSYNTYVWNDKMDPRAGILRLVFGLGTRAVNRVEGDYPRMVALDDPLRKPYGDMNDIRQFSQHEVDLINTKENTFQTQGFAELVNEKVYDQTERVAIRDEEASQMMSGKGQEKEYWILTLDNLFTNKTLSQVFTQILKTLEKSYDYPVEIEFTVNFTSKSSYKINLLQCRPLQTRGLGQKVELPKKISPNNILFASPGYFLGGNISQDIKRIIYVDPQKYTALAQQEKYEIARIIGRLNQELLVRETTPALLIGPGRWGTTTPSLGVPVKFAEINNVTVLAELAFSQGNLMPELSFGTHFFQDLVETNIFYVAIFPEKEKVQWHYEWLQSLKDTLIELLPESAAYQGVVSVYDVSAKNVKIMSDVVAQKIVCFAQERKS
ncbi:MAG: PEP/pyruvate-binding domain-containing protein [Candidatus Omnitrophota bacterium]